MTERGTFAVDRSVWGHPLLNGEPYTRREAWMWLLSEAAFRPHGRKIGGEIIQLQRGQLAHSIRFMADKWGWKRTRVERFLGRLKTETMIGTAAGTGVSVISICNYDAYQAHPRQSGIEIGTRIGTAAGQQRDKVEKLNNGKEKIRSAEGAFSGSDGWPVDAFSQWYALYPKKRSPKDAQRAFLKMVASGEITFDRLMAATRSAAAEWRRWPIERKQFIPYPASWLNAGDYLNEDHAAAVSPETAIHRAPSAFSEPEWQTILRQHARTGVWVFDHWGPEPGQPGCHVPSRLLVTEAVA